MNAKSSFGKKIPLNWCQPTGVLGAALIVLFTSSSSAFAATGISNSADLQNISLTGDYVLTDSITISESFNQISDFQGKLNGDGFSIIMSAPRAKPIFLQLTDAVIENLSIQANINSGDTVVAALAERSNNSDISNISLTGTVLGGRKTGGLIGIVDEASTLLQINISNLLVSGGNLGTGAVSAENSGSMIDVNASENVNVSGGSIVGGISGANSGSITNPSFEGNIRGYEIIGGIAGINTGSITNATYGSNADVVNDGVNFVYRIVGGIAGKNSGTISDSDVQGDLKGLEKVGGVVGENESSGVILNSEFSGKVFDDELSPNRDRYLYNGIQMGGIAGTNSGLISNSIILPSARIEGGGQVGGVVGTNFNNGQVRNSQVRGTLVGLGSAGGVAGVNLEGGIVHTSTVNAVINSSFPVGGIIGNNAGEVYNSISSSTINGDQYTGGIAGINTGTIINAVVSENSRISGGLGATGGAVGMNSALGTVFKVFVNGEVTAVRLASGIVGLNSGTVYLSNFSGKVEGEISDANSLNIDGGTSNQLTSKISDLMSEAKVDLTLIPENATTKIAEAILQNLEKVGVTNLTDSTKDIYQVSLNSNDFAKTELKIGSSIQVKIKGNSDQVLNLWIISDRGKIINLGEIVFDSLGNSVLPALTLTEEANLQFVWGEEISPVYNSANEIESLSVGSSTGILSIKVTS